MVDGIIEGLFLGMCSWHDIRTKKIPLQLLLFGFGLGLINTILQLSSSKRSLWEALLCLLPGTALFLYSKAVNGKLGMGDGWMILTMGLFLGFEGCIALLAAGCFLTIATALPLLIFKKIKKDTQLPFAPYLLAAFLIMKAGGLLA